MATKAYVGLMCRGCMAELATRQDAHEIVVRGEGHGPFCAACARSAVSITEGIPFAQWLDEQWQRQSAH